MSSNLIVRKYGGSSLSTPEKLKSIAKEVSALYQKGHKIILVVSAMGSTTNELLDLAKKISSKPNPRELDMLLTSGERISMSLMCMALSDLNTPAISFTGSQAGILTDGSHNDAHITEIKPIRVEEALSQNKVIVLAGFQGVNPKTKEVMTLGRGGSDTTAVAMAAHFKADECQVYKDVDGIFSLDPNIYDNAIHYEKLPFDVALDMCKKGAKILHYKSVELAQNLNIPIRIQRAHQSGNSSLITDKSVDIKKGLFLALNKHELSSDLLNRCDLALDPSIIPPTDFSEYTVLSLTSWGSVKSEDIKAQLSDLQSKGVDIKKSFHGEWGLSIVVSNTQADSAFSHLAHLIKS